MEERRPRERGLARHAARARPLRARVDVGRRSGKARDGAQRPAHRGRHRRGRIFRGVGRAGASSATPATWCSSTIARWPCVTPKGVQFKTLDGKTVERKPTRVTWDPISAEKAGYKHFMLKEIFEQPHAVRDTVLGRASLETGQVHLNEMAISDADLRAVDKITLLGLRHLVACGAGRQVHDRGARQGRGRSRLRLGVPLPQSDHRQQVAWPSRSRSRAKPRIRSRPCVRRKPRARGASRSATSSAAWPPAKPKAPSTRTPARRSAWRRPRRSPRSWSRSTCLRSSWPRCATRSRKPNAAITSRR